MNKGFTLIELLVVILIIGILSVVALPQYTDAVERSRSAEVMVNAKAIMDGIQRFRQMYPDPTEDPLTGFSQLADVQIKGISAREGDSAFHTKNFDYVLNGANQTLTVTRNTTNSFLSDTPNYRVVYTYTDNGPLITCQVLGQNSSGHSAPGAERICSTFRNLSVAEISESGGGGELTPEEPFEPIGWSYPN